MLFLRMKGLVYFSDISSVGYCWLKPRTGVCLHATSLTDGNITEETAGWFYPPLLQKEDISVLIRR